MKKILIYGITSIVVSGTFATGVNILGKPSNNHTSDTPISETNSVVSARPSTQYVPTAQEKFMNRLVNDGNIDLNANVDINVGEQNINAVFEGTVSYADLDLNNIKAGGNLLLTYDDIVAGLDIVYLDGMIYAKTASNSRSLPEMNCKLSTDSLMTGVGEILSLFNIDLGNVNLGNSGIELDAMSLLATLQSMEFKGSGDKYTANFDLNDDISLKIHTDGEYALTGLELMPINMGETTISANIGAHTHKENNIKSPETPETPYDDYSTITSLITNAYKLSEMREFDLALNLDLKKDEKDFISLNSGLVFDINNRDVALNASATFNQITYDVFAQYDSDNGVYFKLNDLLKGKLSNGNITRIQDIIENYLGSDIMSFAKTKIDEVMNSSQVDSLKTLSIATILEAFKVISYQNNTLTVNIDGEGILNSPCGLTLVINSDTRAINEIEITNFQYGAYSGTLSVELHEYQGMPEIDETQFEDYSPILDLYDEVMLLSQETQFAFDVNVAIEHNGKTYTLTGFVQFALNKEETTAGVIENNSAYVDLMINDGVKDHKLILDLRNHTALLAYNDKMYGTIEVATIKEMANEIMTLINNDDPLLSGLKDLIPSAEEFSILGQILNNNYENVSLDLLKEFHVNANLTTVTLAKSLLGLNEDLTINIAYENSKLVGLEIPTLGFNALNLSLNANFATYDPNLKLPESTTENPINYLDLNLLNILFEYGFPMLQHEYYNVSGTIHLDLGIGSLKIINENIATSLKVRNANGKVGLEIKLEGLPIIGIGNYSTKLSPEPICNQDSGYKFDKSSHRNATIYISNNEVYIERTEEASFKKYIFPKYHYITENYVLAIKTTTSDFLANIFTYLMHDILGFSDTIMELILKETGNGLTPEEMKFDELIKSFTYDEAESKFGIGLNLAALMGNESIKDTNVGIYHSKPAAPEATLETTPEGSNETQKYLTRVTLSMNIASILNVGLDLNVDSFDSFGATYIDDQVTAFLGKYTFDGVTKVTSHNTK